MILANILSNFHALPHTILIGQALKVHKIYIIIFMIIKDSKVNFCHIVITGRTGIHHLYWVQNNSFTGPSIPSELFH